MDQPVLTLGQKIRNRRRQAWPVMTQAELAQKAHLHKNSIYRIECDLVQPGACTLTAIAEALNVAPDDLLAELTPNG